MASKSYPTRSSGPAAGDKRALLLLPFSGPQFSEGLNEGGEERQSRASPVFIQPHAFLECQLDA